MAGSVGDRTGGILALCRLIERYGEGIEFDLLDRCGWSLDDLGRLFSWRDLWVLIRKWQRTPGTATCAEVHGHQWTDLEHLIANVVDVLQIANWQRVGKKGAPKPKPTKRPAEKVKSYGKGAIPFDEIDGWIASTIREE